MKVNYQVLLKCKESARPIVCTITARDQAEARRKVWADFPAADIRTIKLIQIRK